LSVEEKEVWRSVLADLRDLKVGKKPDSRTLERYCIETCLWRRAREFIAKYGVSYPIKELRKNPDGSQSEVIKCFCQFPQVAEMHKRAQTLLRIEQEFGLTPASRARLNMEAAQATQLPTRRRGAK
jgi:P27 family predicted phage terminase small subunit